MRILLALVLVLSPAPATEIATGKMLGAGRDPRAFYMRAGEKQPWRKTYTGPAYRPEAAGRLMNLRIAQAIVHDEWLREEEFDPEANTNRVIAALDRWKAHGVLAISVSLQGANPAYELTKTIKRIRPYKLGPEKGMLTSAFMSDGGRKPAWLARLLRLARALDQRGMVLHLIYFYQHQDEILKDQAAVDRAAAGMTDWLIENNLRNVLIEVANEVDADTYDHPMERELSRLIELIRSRFAAKRAGFRLPISSSTTGGARMPIPEGVRRSADFILLHGNHRTAPEKGQRVRELLADANMPGPVVFSEDNNGRETDPETLAKEMASLEAIFAAGGSWGYMPWRQSQIFPFRMYDPFGFAGRDGEYFRRVLQRMQSLVLKTPVRAQRLLLDEDFRRVATSGVQPQDTGEQTLDGWRVTSERCQLKFDLGRAYQRGAVEVVLRGPLQVERGKRNAVALWNEEAASDGDRKTQDFFQLRLQESGMMLRLTHRAGGRSFEGATGPLNWDPNRWYTLRGEWDTQRGVSHLWRDGELLKSGAFSNELPGFRWLFLGKDNYQKFHSIPGVVYRSLRVWVE